MLFLTDKLIHVSHPLDCLYLFMYLFALLAFYAVLKSISMYATAANIIMEENERPEM